MHTRAYTHACTHVHAHVYTQDACLAAFLVPRIAGAHILPYLEGTPRVARVAVKERESVPRPTLRQSTVRC